MDRKGWTQVVGWGFLAGLLLTLVSGVRNGASPVTVTLLGATLGTGVAYLWLSQFFAQVGLLTRGLMARSRARALLRRGDHDEMARILEQQAAGEANPERKNAVLMSLGALHVVRGDYGAAAETFESIDRDALPSSDAAAVDLNLVSTHVAAGDFVKARQVLDRIDRDRLRPDLQLAYNINHSAILVGQKDHAAAIAFVESLQVENLLPQQRFPFLRDLAEAQALGGDAETAVKRARECVALDPGPQARNVLGLALVQAGKVEAGVEELLVALAENPDGKANRRVFAETLYYLGYARRAEGQADQARALFEQASGVRGGGRFARNAAQEAT